MTLRTCKHRDPLADGPPRPYVFARDTNGDFRAWGRLRLREGRRLPLSRTVGGERSGLLAVRPGPTRRGGITAHSAGPGSAPDVDRAGSPYCAGTWGLHAPDSRPLERAIQRVSRLRFYPVRRVRHCYAARLGAKINPILGHLTRNPWFPSLLAQTEWRSREGYKLAGLVPEVRALETVGDGADHLWSEGGTYALFENGV